MFFQILCNSSGLRMKLRWVCGWRCLLMECTIRIDNLKGLCLQQNLSSIYDHCCWLPNYCNLDLGHCKRDCILVTSVLKALSELLFLRKILKHDIFWGDSLNISLHYNVMQHLIKFLWHLCQDSEHRYKIHLLGLLQYLLTVDKFVGISTRLHTSSQ